MMQSTNRKSNALQSILGIFLQSMHTPQHVVDTLAWIGILISMDSIHSAIKSLSIESQNTMRDLGRSLLASYAYDNFDVDMKTHVPSAEKSNESLKHLTSDVSATAWGHHSTYQEICVCSSLAINGYSMYASLGQ